MNETGILVWILFEILPLPSLIPKCLITVLGSNSLISDSLTQRSQNIVAAFSNESVHLVFASNKLQES